MYFFYFMSCIFRQHFFTPVNPHTYTNTPVLLQVQTLKQSRWTRAVGREMDYELFVYVFFFYIFKLNLFHIKFLVYIV